MYAFKTSNRRLCKDSSLHFHPRPICFFDDDACVLGDHIELTLPT